MKTTTTIYRYGWMAWFWRLLIVPMAAGGLLSLWAGVKLDDPWLLVGAVALLGPSYFFGTALAVRIDRIDGSRIRVHTLLFWRRYFDRSAFGVARYRRRHRAENPGRYAPRLWQPIRGHIPIYIDLFGEIPNVEVFRLFFRVPPGVIKAQPSPETDETT